MNFWVKITDPSTIDQLWHQRPEFEGARAFSLARGRTIIRKLSPTISRCYCRRALRQREVQYETVRIAIAAPNKNAKVRALDW